MRTTKEADLNAALLQYVNKCRAERDDRALAHLGLDRQDAEAAASLCLGDLDHLQRAAFLAAAGRPDRPRSVPSSHRPSAPPARARVRARCAPRPRRAPAADAPSLRHGSDGLCGARPQTGAHPPDGSPERARRGGGDHRVGSLPGPQETERRGPHAAGLSRALQDHGAIASIWLVVQRAPVKPRPATALPRRREQSQCP